MKRFSFALLAAASLTFADTIPFEFSHPNYLNQIQPQNQGVAQLDIENPAFGVHQFPQLGVVSLSGKRVGYLSLFNPAALIVWTTLADPGPDPFMLSIRNPLVDAQFAAAGGPVNENGGDGPNGGGGNNPPGGGGNPPGGGTTPTGGGDPPPGGGGDPPPGGGGDPPPGGGGDPPPGGGDPPPGGGDPPPGGGDPPPGGGDPPPGGGDPPPGGGDPPPGGGDPPPGGGDPPPGGGDPPPTPTAVPEPGSVVMVLLGGFALAASNRRVRSAIKNRK